MTVDTLEYAQDLEAAGVSREQAQAHARALKKAADVGLVTKADLENAVGRLEARVDTGLSRLRADIEAAMWKHTVGILLGVLAIGGLLIRFLR
jgi:hypothetical protein